MVKGMMITAILTTEHDNGNDDCNDDKGMKPTFLRIFDAAPGCMFRICCFHGYYCQSR